MKKHAKKSLLVPILALASVIAIAACCYLAQSFSAYAQEDSEPKLELSNSQNNISAANLDAVSATIRFSNNESFWGTTNYENFSAPFYPTDELFAVINDATNLYYALDNEENTCTIYGTNKYFEPVYPSYTIYIPYTLTCSGVNLSWIDDNRVSVSILVNNAYFLTFDAGLGSWNGWHWKTIRQGEYNMINLPETNPQLGENWYFAGWFTDPYFGEQVFPGSQAPAQGTWTTLYAHWAPVSQTPKIIVNSADPRYQFAQALKIKVFEEGNELNSYEANDNGPTHIEVPEDLAPMDPSNFLFTYSGPNALNFYWTNHIENKLVEVEAHVCAMGWNEGERIRAVYLNQSEVPYNSTLETYLPYNYFNVFIGKTYPGTINVFSNNQAPFKCLTFDDTGSYDESVASYVPINVDKDEYAFFTFGAPSNIVPYLNSSEIKYDNAVLSILVLTFSNDIEYDGVFEIESLRCYQFGDCLFSLFDVFGWNSYIVGLNHGFMPVTASNQTYEIYDNFIPFELVMSDREIQPTVTYNANGGVFAEGETSLTLDATYGEALPTVKDPTLAENDFIGWFTEAEGGVQVDPANYQWNPWDRWNGVTLYAHWAYNPQPVPPEPVPPEPGPTPVDPDNPGGGGTAQTGDSIPLAPIAAFAVIAALGCALTLRKESSN